MIIRVVEFGDPVLEGDDQNPWFRVPYKLKPLLFEGSNPLDDPYSRKFLEIQEALIKHVQDVTGRDLRTYFLDFSSIGAKELVLQRYADPSSVQIPIWLKFGKIQVMGPVSVPSGVDVRYCMFGFCDGCDISSTEKGSDTWKYLNSIISRYLVSMGHNLISYRLDFILRDSMLPNEGFFRMGRLT